MFNTVAPPDTMVILAAKVIFGIVIVVVSLGISSLIGAIWLRLAALWLRLGDIPYWLAFASSLLSNFVMLAFQLGLCFAQVAVMASFDAPQRARFHDIAVYNFSPLYSLYAMLAGVLITAAIFCRMLSDRQSDARLPYVDSLALTAVYFALSITLTILLALLAVVALGPGFLPK